MQYLPSPNMPAEHVCLPKQELQQDPRPHKPSVDDASTRVRCGSASATRGEDEESFVMKHGRRASIDSAAPSTMLSLSRAAATMTKKRKKSVRFPSDDTEFYSNIWTTPPIAAPTKKFIDITQIAFVVASMRNTDQYKAAAERMDIHNVWSDEDWTDTDEEPEASPVKAKESGKHQFDPVEDHEDSLSTEEDGNSVTDSSCLRTSQDVASPRVIPVAPPSRRDDMHAVFSAVLSGINLNTSWSARFLLALHEPIRHALYVIDRFLEQSHASQSPAHWNTEAFFTWFTQYFVQFVEAQHTTKAQVLQPLLPIPYPIKREIMDCYEEVTFMLETVSMHEENLSAAARSDQQTWTQSIIVLQADIRRLNETLRQSLNLEERTLQPLLQSTFNKRIFDSHLMPRILREMQHKRVVIPWIIERCRIWSGDEEADAFRQQLSLPSRFLYDHRWYPFFVHNVAGAMKTLDSTLVNFPKEDEGSWFGCSIQ